MEADIAVKIWNRSVEKHNMRYTKFVGDGDSKAFNSMTESSPYGEHVIKKAECVGHIQKRMGKGLRDFKKNKKNYQMEKILEGKGD